MNKEQAVKYLSFSGFSDEQIKAIEGAFSCEDAISRQAVLKIIDGWYEQNRDTDNIEDLIVLITYMDSVNPQKPKIDWIVPIILIDKKGEEHDGLMDMRRMLIYLHNIPAETAISLGYTWKSAEGSGKE